MPDEPDARPVGGRAADHLLALVSDGDRRPGSAANEAAVDYAADVLRRLGWQVATPGFDVVTWHAGHARIAAGDVVVALQPSWHGTGGTATGTLIAAGDRAALEGIVASGAGAGGVLLLHGDLTGEPLTPEGYPFYGVPEHDEIRGLLRASRAAVILAATPPSPVPRPPAPYIEDGRFPVPVADIAAGLLPALLACAGREADVRIHAGRHHGTARNVVARNRGGDRPGRVLLTAHIDTKPGTPGALDNAAGVAAVLRAAAAPSVVAAEAGVEIVLFNGEDHFAAPGEQAWLAGLRERGEDIDSYAVMINVDAVGARGSVVEWSGYHLAADVEARVAGAMAAHSIAAGPAWFQSDHGIFAMAGRPAVALTSSDIATLLATVVHSADDTVDRVDPGLVEQAARGIAAAIPESFRPAGPTTRSQPPGP